MNSTISEFAVLSTQPNSNLRDLLVVAPISELVFTDEVVGFQPAQFTPVPATFGERIVIWKPASASVTQHASISSNYVSSVETFSLVCTSRGRLCNFGDEHNIDITTLTRMCKNILIRKRKPVVAEVNPQGSY